MNIKRNSMFKNQIYVTQLPLRRKTPVDKDK